MRMIRNYSKAMKYLLTIIFLFVFLNVILNVSLITQTKIDIVPDCPKLSAKEEKHKSVKQEIHDKISESLQRTNNVLFSKVVDLAKIIVEIKQEAEVDDRIGKLLEQSVDKLLDIMEDLKPGTVDSLEIKPGTVDSLEIKPETHPVTDPPINPDHDNFHNYKSNAYAHSNKPGMFKKSEDDHLHSMEPDTYQLGKADPDRLYTVCPEKYTSRANFDIRYDLYPNLFEKLPCRHIQRSKLVTMVMNLASYPNKALIQTMRIISLGMAEYFPDIKVKVGISTKHTKPQITNNQFEFISYANPMLTADIWNGLISQVKTPNVLVARDIDFITHDIALDRLIREIDDLNVPIIGGAFRTPDGHWNMGCQQTAFRNYTVTYKKGYKHSKHDCVFCDHIDGPFLAKTSFLRKMKFYAGIRNSPGLFETLFLDTKLLSDKRLALCPDSMFHLRQRVIHKRVDWVPFAAYWGVNILNLPNGTTFQFSCQESKTDKIVEVGMATPPCQLQILANAVKTIMQICEENKIQVEIAAGTLLGAIKFNKILPWELDADMVFLTKQTEEFVRLGPEITQAGYDFQVRQNISDFWDGVIIDVMTYYWRVEIWGHPRMQSEEMLKNNLAPTKVLLDGQWINAPTNPGADMRNYVWPEIYRHAQHLYDVQAETADDLYNTSKFTTCRYQGNVNCLDQYRTDGSLQFEQTIF